MDNELKNNGHNLSQKDIAYYRALKFLARNGFKPEHLEQAEFIKSIECPTSTDPAVAAYSFPFMIDSALTLKDAEEQFEEFFKDSSDRKNILEYFGFDPQKIDWKEFDANSVTYKVARFPKNPNAYLVRTLFPSLIPNHNALKENIVFAPTERKFHDFWQKVAAAKPQLKTA